MSQEKLLRFDLVLRLVYVDKLVRILEKYNTQSFLSVEVDRSRNIGQDEYRSDGLPGDRNSVNRVVLLESEWKRLQPEMQKFCDAHRGWYTLHEVLEAYP